MTTTESRPAESRTAEITPELEAGDLEQRSRTWSWIVTVCTSPQLAGRVFGAYLAVAWLVLMLKWGRDRWYSGDEWVFLISRDGGSFWSVFQPFGEHLTAVPVLVYRILFNLAGLRYGLYLAVVVSMHIGLAAAIWHVMRRSGVSAWTTTLVAALLPLYGSGEENILGAFQIGFVGSALFLYLQILLVDHEGRDRVRDSAALGFAMLAILSPGFGPLGPIVVGVITLLKRGHRVAMIQVLPPLVVYVLWYVATTPRRPGSFQSPSIRVTLNWASEGLLAPIGEISQNRWVALALGALVIGGGILILFGAALRPYSRLIAPVVLLLAAPTFYAIIAQGRSWSGIGAARSTRYVYMATVLVLPALGIALDAVVRRWRGAYALAFPLVLAGIPANISRFDSDPFFNSRFFSHERDVVLGIAMDPRLDNVPPWVLFSPKSSNELNLTTGWLRWARDHGYVPDVGPVDPLVASEFELRLSLVYAEALNIFPPQGCQSQVEGTHVSLVRGDRIRIFSPVTVMQSSDGAPTSSPVEYAPLATSNELVVLADRLEVDLSGAWGVTPYWACLLE